MARMSRHPMAFILAGTAPRGVTGARVGRSPWRRVPSAAASRSGRSARAPARSRCCPGCPTRGRWRSPRCSGPAPKPALKALTAPQYAALDVLVDAIIPTDERSPGAKEARVADYIDLLLSEADAEVRQQWIDGLAARRRRGVDAVRRAGREADGAAGRGAADRDQRQRARSRRPPAERFFVMTKRADDPRLLHLGDRHPQGPPLQGQPVPAGVPRLPDRGREGLSALRTEGDPEPAAALHV